MPTDLSKIDKILQNIRRGAGLEGTPESFIEMELSHEEAKREPLIESSGETYGRPISVCFAGVGTCGVNILMSLKEKKLESGMVDFVGINSDGGSIRELENRGFNNNIALSTGDSYYLGAGGNLEAAKKLGEKYYDQFLKRFTNKDLILVVTGMGGGTGTGVAPIVAKAAKDAQKGKPNTLTIGVTTMPSGIELGKRELAMQGIEDLRKYVDAIVIIDELHILEVLEQDDASADEADDLVDSRFQTVLQSIMDTVTIYTKRNIDFADVCSTLKNCGDAIITTVEDDSDNIEDTKKALAKAVNDKLLVNHLDKVASRLLVYHFYEKGYSLKKHYEIVSEVQRLFGWTKQQDGGYYLCQVENPSAITFGKRGGDSREECKGKNIVIIMAGGFEEPPSKTQQQPVQRLPVTTQITQAAPIAPPEIPPMQYTPATTQLYMQQMPRTQVMPAVQAALPEPPPDSMQIAPAPVQQESRRKTIEELITERNLL
jgi:cell division protein FtsZ